MIHLERVTLNWERASITSTSRHSCQTLPWLMIGMECLREHTEQASILHWPWLLLQFLSPGSCLHLLPRILWWMEWDLSVGIWNRHYSFQVVFGQHIFITAIETPTQKMEVYIQEFYLSKKTLPTAARSYSRSPWVVMLDTSIFVCLESLAIGK